MDIRPADLRAALRIDPFDEEEARLKLAHAHRKDYPRPEVYRDGAVLALFYPGPEGLSLLLTRRTDTVEHHRGQISFPGGAREGAESLEETALRETREELGLDLRGLEVLGRLPPLDIPVSGFRVWPFVGHLPRLPEVRPDSREVSEVLTPPLALLLDPGSRRERDVTIHGRPYRVPVYDLPGVEPPPLWGATAMMISGLLERLQCVLQSGSSKGSEAPVIEDS